MNNKYILINILFWGFGLSQLLAQTNVNLKINHKVGTESYQKNKTYTNNLGHQYNISRLEYYVSMIVIKHDGGKLDTLDDTYLLVNPVSASDNFSLGNRNITKIEAIQFGIGVEPGVNNGDPTTYFSTHPLAPKTPSMHWGWSAGYRFLAVEGKAGNNLNSGYEMHGLWNANFFIQEIPVDVSATNGAVEIELNADYNKIMYNIDLTKAIFSHGSDEEDLTALRNMQLYVFTNLNGQGNVLSNKEIKEINTFNIYPNPVTTTSKISVETTLNNFEISVFNAQGKQITCTKTSEELLLENKGVYFIQIHNLDNPEEVITKKIVVY